MANPLIVQSDRTLLLETDNEYYEVTRDHISKFAELVKSPEHVHTYKITPLSLWNAASAGMDAEHIITVLKKYSKYEIPPNIIQDIKDYTSRYGKLKLVKENEDSFVLKSEDDILITEICHHKQVMPYIEKRIDRNSILINKAHRGLLKQALIKIGFPVEDLAGYVPGSFIDLNLNTRTKKGKEFHLRDYQKDAIEIFYAGGSEKGGSGVIVLPCGAGKTIVGMGVIAKLKTYTLILVTNVTAARQWIDELLDKTDIPEDKVGEYTGEIKSIMPITVSTYQILTYRKSKSEEFIHFRLFNQQNWGLIIYDEVHLLPAPVFRMAAELQAKRRLGLTATLVREDGREDDVFSLIGPKKYDVPWKELEKQGWIATAICNELRVSLPPEKRLEYAIADPKEKFRIASTNPKKLQIIKELVEKHNEDNILIIGQYIDQLEDVAQFFQAPIITGKTKYSERERLFSDFKSGRLKKLIVSKVANFAIDLPDANVAIQISGTFGSRQEEAQRLGRILRPKPTENQAHFYTIVSKDTKEQDFAMKRQLFLTEQGYKYNIYTV